ncbi:MAG: flippase-like domain-containing protein [Odoribacter sp.]|nr:flippase-like domain-containing protein [Odoribacter sp.]
MQNKYKQIIKFFIFLLISVFLFWLVYRDQSWSELKEILTYDVNYWWVGVAAIMGILSHISRALRWQLVATSMGYHIRFPNSFMGIMIGYFANLIIPRMGEFTRCGVVAKYEDIPFSKLLGTIVTERIIDMIILLLLTLFVIFAQFNQIDTFLEKNPGIEEKALSLINSIWLWVIVIAFPFVIYFSWLILKRTRVKDKISNFGRGLKEGLISVKDVKQKGLFIFYSLFIWLMYYLMFYVCFFCFDFTSHLGPLVGLTVFILGSYGMVAPVQGGIGAWHFMVISAMLIYLPNTPGIESMTKTFALLTHGAMTLLYIVVGVICLVAIPIYNKRNPLSTHD